MAVVAESASGVAPQALAADAMPALLPPYGGSWASLDIVGTGAEVAFAERLKPIPRFQATDPEALQLMRAGQPVVLLGTKLAEPLVGRWTVDYLAPRVNQDANFLVKVSPGLFMHSDSSKSVCGYNFTSAVRWERMKFREFVRRVEVPHRSSGGPREERLYLQEGLTVECFGQDLANDYGGCNWNLLVKLKEELGMGKLSDQLLLIGEQGTVTHAHFDEQHNLYAQIHGQKRAILVSPDQWGKMYPHPVGHAADRQSQVDAYNPDFERHPRFAEVEAVEVVLEPGEVLYIPEMWWHMFENRYSPITVSSTFWFNIAPPSAEQLRIPIREPRMRVTVRRNLEKEVLKKLKGSKAAEFFKAWQQGQELSGEFAAQLQVLRHMCASVFDPSEDEAFLDELVRGRFDLPILGVHG